MAEESQNCQVSTFQNSPALNYLDKSCLSHILNWKKQLITLPSKTEALKPQVAAIQGLNPYTRLLTRADLESCAVLEECAYFDPQDRVTRDELEYRLSKCGELCLGLFCTVIPGSDFQAETLASSNVVETGRTNGAVSVLLGHIIASMTNDPTATENSIRIPDDWQSPIPEKSSRGHQRDGRTIILRSLAVLPRFQRRGIGNTLILAYIQQMSGTGISDRLALVTHENTLAWFEKRGFTNHGLSKLQIGSGGWYDLIKELPQSESDAESLFHV